MKQNSVPQLQELHIGDTVRLNSGGPDAVIVAASSDGQNITIEWKDRCTLPRPCVHLATL